jgi:hypothetical protein
VRCYRQRVNQRLCPRCGTPAQPGGTACERCEEPLDGPAPVRYNPAGLALPSPIQGHATVLVGVIAAVALLVAGAWFLYHGVGPFHTTLVKQSVEADAQGGPEITVVDLRVRNEGSRSGRARCRLSGVQPDGSLVNSAVKLTQNIPGHSEVIVTLRAANMRDAHDVGATCS